MRSSQRHGEQGLERTSHFQRREAEANFGKALEHGADDRLIRLSVHVSRGVLLIQQKKYAEAESEDREAIRLNPNEPLYHNNLGVDLYNQKKYAAAEAEYKEAKRLKK